MKYILCGMVASLVLTGCQSTKLFSDSEPKPEPAYKPAENKATEIPKIKSSKIEVPEWFLSRENADGKLIVVTATDVSKDMQFAIDKASVNAKVQIASRIKSDIDALIRETTSETGSTAREVDRVIDRVSRIKVNQSIAMFKREHLSVVREGDLYRAYVMFTLNVDDLKRLMSAKESSRDQKFKDLDKPSTNSTPATLPVPAAQSNAQPVAPVQTPTKEVSSAAGIEFKPGKEANLLQVENAEYKQRREEALKNPDVVVGRITVR